MINRGARIGDPSSCRLYRQHESERGLPIRIASARAEDQYQPCFRLRYLTTACTFAVYPDSFAGTCLTRPFTMLRGGQLMVM